MIKIRHIFVAILCVHLFCISILGDETDEIVGKLSVQGKQILSTGEGKVNDAIFARIAQQLSLKDFASALYGPSRAYRRIALDAAAYTASPLDYVPYLVSFMEAGERQAASAAATSLFIAMEHVFDLRTSQMILLHGQAEQLVQMLLVVVQNQSLEVDVRVQAVRLISRLSGGTSKLFNEEVGKLLGDSAVEVREATLSSLQLPLGDAQLKQVARAASGDDVPRVRGAAVAMICENALSHHVTQPSADLKALVMELLIASNEADVIAPVLGCIARFPYRTRAELTDRILNCDDEKIVEYWKSLSDT